MATADQTASAIVTSMLSRYGLQYDQATVNRWVGLMSDDPNNMALIEEEIRESQIFQDRFSGLQQRIDNGYNAISIDEYLQLEDGYRQTMRAMGMPETFYDDADDFNQFIANDVSVTEVEQRVAQGFVAAQQAPQEIRDALSRYYNIPDADAALAAYYLDPDRALPAIERQFEAATVAGAAKRTAFGDLAQADAERLADLGVSGEQATQGFGELAGQRELFGSNLGTDTAIDQQTQMAAMFEGDADARERIKRRREQRLSAFQGSTGGGASSRGIAGLQDADRS